jgi:hypothetical protein
MVALGLGVAELTVPVVVAVLGVAIRAASISVNVVAVRAGVDVVAVGAPFPSEWTSSLLVLPWRSVSLPPEWTLSLSLLVVASSPLLSTKGSRMSVGGGGGACHKRACGKSCTIARKPATALCTN